MGVIDWLSGSEIEMDAKKQEKKVMGQEMIIN